MNRVLKTFSLRILARLLLIACGFCSAWQLRAAEAEGVEFFEKKVRPILVDNCYKCHSREAEKLKGNLLLDTRDGLLKGGDTGPSIVPGQPDKSLLIKAVRYTDEDLQMPPKGKKLTAHQISDLETWVKIGAPDPRVAAAAANVSKAQETLGFSAREASRIAKGFERTLGSIADRCIHSGQTRREEDCAESDSLTSGRLFAARRSTLPACHPHRRKWTRS